MCGLTGFLAVGGERMADPSATLARMSASLAHRGPDADGLWWDAQAGVGLGHRRLSILDLSAAGAQPMRSHDGRFVLAYNGEIYNHRDLRARLDGAGPVAWRGHSDTEVLLEAIVAWGLVDTLRRVDGMFALALWDARERTLHLARDRFGEKPLYYGWVGTSLVFGSELKAMREFPGFDPAIDRAALAEYLRRGCVPAPWSIYSGVRKLMPASVLAVSTASAPGDEPRVETYWSARDAAACARAQPFAGGERDAVEQLDALLRDAVGRRMEADVPLGALLSGGIDSSTVVASMQAQRRDRVRTFSIGSRMPGYDEIEHARAVARHLGTEHTELVVDGADALAVVPRLPAMYDEPFADSSQIPTFLVSQLARRHVTVALSGDAGDELFGGYNRYFHGDAVWRRSAPVPRRLRAWLGRGLSAVPPARLDRLVSSLGPLAPRELAAGRAGEKVHKLAGLLDATDLDDFHGRLLSVWPDAEAVVIGAPARADAARSRLEPGWSFAEAAMLADTQHYLPDDILAKVDRASMAVGLEVRVPLLDVRVFAFAWSLPLALKVGGGRGKHVLREVLARYLPREVIDRPKQGFAVPVGAWLRDGLRDWAEALLEPGRLQREGHFDAARVRACWVEHLDGRRNWDARLWTILMFQAWLEAQAGALRAPAPRVTTEEQA